MELVPDGRCTRSLRKGPLPAAQALRIGVRIAAAMEAAHAEGIVHRDLKPQNIQIGEADEVKVLDFGLAKAVDEPTAGGDPTPEGPGVPTSTDAPATLSGPVAGTPGYISPEQLLGLPAGTGRRRLGIRLRVVRMPGRGVAVRRCGLAALVPTRLRLTLGALDLDPDWSRLPADLPAGIDALLRSCLRTDPGDRPAAADARRTLERGLEELAAPSLAARLVSCRGAVALVCLLLAIAGAVTVGRTWRTEPAGLPASTVRQLTFRGNTMGSDLSPDGRTAAYPGRDGTPDLYSTCRPARSGRRRSRAFRRATRSRSSARGTSACAGLPRGGNWRWWARGSRPNGRCRPTSSSAGDTGRSTWARSTSPASPGLPTVGESPERAASAANPGSASSSAKTDGSRRAHLRDGQIGRGPRLDRGRPALPEERRERFGLHRAGDRRCAPLRRDEGASCAACRTATRSAITRTAS